MPPNCVGVAWLGQAGFLFRASKCRLLIDPYLSDHLAAKYRGTEFTHQRLMAAPLEAVLAFLRDREHA